MALQEGYQFFLYLNDGSRRYGYALKNAYTSLLISFIISEIKLHRKHYAVSDLIGHPYGTVFEVNGRHLVPVDEPLIPVDINEGSILLM